MHQLQQCEHEMNGAQRAAMHLKAEPSEEKLVQLCPNVTEEQAADCRRLYGQKKYKTGATQPEVVPLYLPSRAFERRPISLGR